MKTKKVLMSDAEKDLIKIFFASRISFDDQKVISIIYYLPMAQASRDIVVRFISDENREPVIEMIWCGAREIGVNELKCLVVNYLNGKEVCDDSS